MELDKQNRQQEARVTEAESKYSEINNRVEIMQLQTLQSATQTSSGEHQHFGVALDSVQNLMTYWPKFCVLLVIVITSK